MSAAVGSSSIQTVSQMAVTILVALHLF
jgi:hypothetical protein